MENTAELEHPNTSPAGLGQSQEDPLRSGSLHPRLAWMMAYKESGNAQAVCNRFGISRKTFYKWLKRFQESKGDSTSLTDRSRRPHHFPRATRPEHVELLRRAREETGYGQRRLRAYLEENYSISLSERTIWKLLKRDEEELPRAASQA
ncbi:MAG TPA: leucine zipper domain-containing protein [Bacteroidota bacterium]|nr:leucine zipper domain-containing protein [Bacteroidota bacterium]